MAQRVKRLPAMQETWVQSLGWEDPLEKEMGTHSGTLAWKIPWMEKPVGYSLWGCKESDTTEQLHFHFTYWEGKPVFRQSLEKVFNLRTDCISALKRILSKHFFFWFYRIYSVNNKRPLFSETIFLASHMNCCLTLTDMGPRWGVWAIMVGVTQVAIM